MSEHNWFRPEWLPYEVCRRCGLPRVGSIDQPCRGPSPNPIATAIQADENDEAVYGWMAEESEEARRFPG